MCVVESCQVTLYRYDDPLAGPRRIPVFGQMSNGLVAVDKEAVFSINNETNSVIVQENGQAAIAVGNQLVYVVS